MEITRKEALEAREYFGLSATDEIELPVLNQNQDEFVIFDRAIGIVTPNTAMSNEVSMMNHEENIMDYISETNIGSYRKMDKFYFRWL